MRTTDRNPHPLHPLPPAGRTFVAGLESTYHPAAGVDALDTTAHAVHRERDLADLRRAGVRHLRYPLRWQRIEPRPGVFDWSETDRVGWRWRTCRRCGSSRRAMAWRQQVRLTPLAADLEQAHTYGVGAASAGLQDAGLGPVRLTGTAVPVLAEAAVTSATPFLRAPLLSRLHRVRRLHTAAPPSQVCPTCAVPAPCPTVKELDA